MFERLANGWRLASEVRKMVFKDKSLMTYPIVSMLIAFAMSLVIFGTFFVFVTNPAFSGAIVYLVLLAIVLLFVVYFLLIFIVSYILLAMYVAFKSSLAGNKIGMLEALARVKEYIMPLAEWSLFYALVITFLRALESQIRGITGAVIGVATSVALSISLLFIMPVIYNQKLGPISAMKKSAEVFVQHFGSTIGGIAYSDTYGLIFIALGSVILLCGVGISTAFIGVVADAIVDVLYVFGYLFVLFGAIVAYTTSNIFKFILFDYATGMGLPAGFDENLIKNALISKKQNIL